MSLIGTVWSWILISCPVVFIAGLVWISRAKHLREPVAGVPSMTRWVLVSVGSLGLLVLMGGLFFLAFLGHGSDADWVAWITLPVIVVGPVYYFVSAMKWFTRVRRGLREQGTTRRS